MVGRRQAQAASGEPEWTARAAAGAWRMRRAGTSKAGQTDGWADGQADGPNQAKIARWLVALYCRIQCN